MPLQQLRLHVGAALASAPSVLCNPRCCFMTALSCRLSSSKSNKALVVDPVEPRKILDAVQQAGLEVAGCLTTHHHA